MGVFQYTFECTHRLDAARGLLCVEACDDMKVRFRVQYHIPNIDFLWWPRQLHAASLSTVGVDIAVAGEVMHHLDQVVTRDAVVLGDLGDGRLAVRART